MGSLIFLALVAAALWWMVRRENRKRQEALHQQPLAPPMSQAEAHRRDAAVAPFFASYAEMQNVLAELRLRITIPPDSHDSMLPVFDPLRHRVEGVTSAGTGFYHASNWNAET